MKYSVRFFSIASLAVGLAISSQSHAASSAYQTAYKCAMEAYKGGDISPNEDPISFCIGNSHDPSKEETKGFVDAQRDFKKSKLIAASNACSFAYATYTANGSMSDQGEEGLKTFKTLSEAADWMVGRDIKFFDAKDQRIDDATVKSWFSPGGKYGNLKVSAVALKTCSKQQIGK